MAQSLDEARAKILTSVHGRRLGIDHTEHLAGVKGIRRAVTEATSDTTGTNLPNHGLVSVVTTTADGWILADPEVGCVVRLVTGTTSTGVHTVTCDNATILSSAQSTMGVISMIGGGAQGCVLDGLSTALWGIASRASTAGTLFTTA